MRYLGNIRAGKKVGPVSSPVFKYVDVHYSDSRNPKLAQRANDCLDRLFVLGIDE